MIIHNENYQHSVLLSLFLVPSNCFLYFIIAYAHIRSIHAPIYIQGLEFYLFNRDSTFIVDNTQRQDGQLLFNCVKFIV